MDFYYGFILNLIFTKLFLNYKYQLMLSKINKTPLKQKGKNKTSPIKLSPSRYIPQNSKLSNQFQFQPALYITSKLKQNDILAIKQAFDNYDSNKTGLLTPNDLKVALLHQGFHASKETVYDIIAEYDQQCLGGLNFSNFIKIITTQPSQAQTLNDIKKVFRKLDRQNKGFLDRKDLQNILKSLGEQWDSQDVEIILQHIDNAEGHRLSFDKFCKIMHSPLSLY